MRTPPPRVLITYGWNRVSYVINRSLSQRGVQTFVAAPEWLTLNRLSRYTYRSLRYPSFYDHSAAFIEWVIDTCRAHEISNWIPSHEETFIASKYEDRLNTAGIRTLIPPLSTLKVAHKKESSAQFAKSLGVPVPHFCCPQTQEEALEWFRNQPKPVVLKELQSNSSKGVFYLQDESELTPFLSSIGQWILQEYVSGEGYGVSFLFSESGKMMARFTHKRVADKLKSGGTSIVRESATFPEMEAAATELLTALEWKGVAMVEFKGDPATGQFWFIEINPRFWGSLALPVYCGIDFPYLMFQLLEGNSPPPTMTYPTGVRVGWMMGLCIRWVTDISQGQIPINPFKYQCAYWDIPWSDLPAIAGEWLHYFYKLVSHLNLNPKRGSLLDIDSI